MNTKHPEKWRKSVEVLAWSIFDLVWAITHNEPIPPQIVLAQMKGRLLVADDGVYVVGTDLFSTGEWREMLVLEDDGFKIVDWNTFTAYYDPA